MRVQHHQQCKNVEGCGWRSVIDVEPGEHPPCPWCGGETERLWLSGISTFRDDIPGGLTVENYGPHPITFYSHSERRRYMQKQGLRERERFAPMPGTDKDPQGIPNPKGYMDPQTLENARILLTRETAQAGRGPRGCPSLRVRQHVTAASSEHDADAIAVQTNTDPKRQSRVFHRRTRLNEPWTKSPNRSGPLTGPVDLREKDVIPVSNDPMERMTCCIGFHELAHQIQLHRDVPEV
jgi:hypothetical protein